MAHHRFQNLRGGTGVYASQHVNDDDADDRQPHDVPSHDVHGCRDQNAIPGEDVVANGGGGDDDGGVVAVSLPLEEHIWKNSSR